MDEQVQLRSLSRRIARGDCVLVLGPGASDAPGANPPVPLSVLLSSSLAQDPQIARIENIDPRDLRHVSQLLYEATRRLAPLQESVAEFYAEYAKTTTDFHRCIASLPFKFCITTTPDDFLFNAFTEAGKKPSRHFFNFRRVRNALLSPPTVENPLVYHLYGHPDEPDSMVITENDLIDFVTSVIRDSPPLAPAVRSELAKPTTNCLFIDLGFKNWYLRALLRVLGVFAHQDSSIAIEDAEFFAQSGIHQTTLYFSASQAIQFREDSLDDFASRLKAAYDQVTSAGARPAGAPPPGAPRVFVSYAHEDRTSVDRLAESLGAAGIAVWQDHQNLRAGDRWEHVLSQVIQKQVDYVIVVQSANLARRVESYVGREVAEALRRNGSMLWGSKFLLPVLLERAPLLPELESLNSIDVSTSAGVQALVTAIGEDVALRARHQSGAVAVAAQP